MRVRFGHYGEYEVERIYFNTIREATNWIDKYAINYKYIDKIYYHNCNFSRENNYIEVDFGSHVYFAIIDELTDENWNEWFEGMEEKPVPIHEKIGVGVSLSKGDESC